MTNAQWFLLARGLTAPMLQRLPVTPAIVYLAVGLLVGPTVLNLFHFNPLKAIPQASAKENPMKTDISPRLNLANLAEKFGAPRRPS